MKRKIIPIILMICLTFSIIPAASVYAIAGPVLVYNLTWDINNIHYYLVGSATNYASPIYDASRNWWRPFGQGSNKLYPNTRIYDQTYSAIDYYAYSAYDGCNAYTNFIINPSKTLVDPNVSNWSFGRIYINNTYANTEQNDFTLAETQQSIMAHEQGHVFGLDEHNDDQNSIMCQMGSGRAVYTVQVTDNDAFKLKHP